MESAIGAESQDSAFLRQALLEAGCGALSPHPSLQKELSTAIAAPVVPQGSIHHPAVPTSNLPPPRTTHPPKVGWYRQLLFELAEPVVLTAEEYIVYWPYISSAYTKNKRLPQIAARTITEHWWCRLWSSTTPKSKGKGERGKTIRIGLGCPFKLKIVEDVASGSRTLSRHKVCSNHSHTLDYLDSVKKPEALRRIAGAEVAHGYPVAMITQTLQATHRPEAGQAWQEAGGRFFSRQDVHNAGASFKVANPDPRFVEAQAA
jgi:2,5-diamino-6-(ribosylamino)-4(3H)-pyrimidinone 5'-phosphate reductase